MSDIMFGDEVRLTERSRPDVGDSLTISGYVKCEALYKPAYMAGTRETMWVEEGQNLITTAGRNYLANVALDATTQITSWYIGLYSDSPAYTASAAHTITNLSTNEFTNYTGDRKLYDPTAATTGSITAVANTSDFDIAGSGDLQGVFVYSIQAKATQTGGTVFAIKDFASVRTVDSSTLLEITYLLTTA